MAIKTGLATALILMTAAPALAGQKLVVEKNHTVRVALSAPAGSVIVGNPDIADVTVIDSRTVYVVGKGFGSSAVTITDRMGRSLFDGEITVTSAEKGGITVYKGLTPSVLVCSTVCIGEAATPSAANTTSMVSMPAAVAQGASGVGNAMQVQ